MNTIESLLGMVATEAYEAAHPVCPHCHGAGEFFTHADDCDDDLCALNGDIHSCVGQVLRCCCRHSGTTGGSDG